MFKNFYYDSIIGKNHHENQDAIICFSNNDIFFSCVCDGIGSTKGSAYASQIFINTFQEYSNKINKKEISELYLRKWFDSLLDEVNNKYSKVISENVEFNKMSTTVCSCIVYKNKVFWFNIGDSRLYYYSFQTNQLLLKTNDQTLRNYFLNNNILNIDKKYTPYLDSLVNSVSYRNKNKMQNYDFGDFTINKNDIIIISSDGAYKFCDFNKLNLKEFKASKKLVDKIIKSSIYNKSHDDISVGVIIC